MKQRVLPVPVYTITSGSGVHTYFRVILLYSNCYYSYYLSSVESVLSSFKHVSIVDTKRFKISKIIAGPINVYKSKF